jgi:hypothetical protein
MSTICECVTSFPGFDREPGMEVNPHFSKVRSPVWVQPCPQRNGQHAGVSPQFLQAYCRLWFKIQVSVAL